MYIQILYEDNHLIAVYKPAGVLVQKGEGPEHDDDTLYWQVKIFIKDRDKKPGNVFLGVLHRLDRPVAGIVLFAKTSKGAARLSEQFRERTIKKTYHAVVVGEPELREATLKNLIQKDMVSLRAIVGESASGLELGDEAVLRYEVVRSNGRYSLLKIELETGRFHKLRAQLASIGHPIVGDIKYGSKEKLKNGQIALASTELKFETATTGELKELKINWPEEWESLIKTS